MADAHFHVTQVRGFERIAQGRPVYEMPSLMARICGICPVSHLIASAKACDEILGVSVPPVAVKLRRVMNLAQIVQSHALSYFHLCSPDLLLGFDSDPANRNILGVVDKAPDMARDGIALRRFGQEIIEKLGGKRVHPAWVVPGGVSAPLQAEQRDAILAMVPDAHARAARALEWYKDNLASWVEEAASLATSRACTWALSTRAAMPPTRTVGSGWWAATARWSSTGSTPGPIGTTSARRWSPGPT